VHGEWALLAAGSDRVELIAYAQPCGRPLPESHTPADLGIAHLALEVDDIEAAFALIVGAGYSVTNRPVNLGRHTTFYVRGPDGEIVEVLEEHCMEPPSSNDPMP
jgi:catechol 2,3-dioxygenase-like lactoylglutathione lyase family enzyme